MFGTTILSKSPCDVSGDYFVGHRNSRLSVGAGVRVGTGYVARRNEQSKRFALHQR